MNKRKNKKRRKRLTRTEKRKATLRLIEKMVDESEDRLDEILKERKEKIYDIHWQHEKKKK